MQRCVHARTNLLYIFNVAPLPWLSVQDEADWETKAEEDLVLNDTISLRPNSGATARPPRRKARFS